VTASSETLVRARVTAWRTGLLALLALAATGLLLRLLEATGIPELRNFLLVFGSLLIEAFPFILLGAVVSAGIEVFVPTRYFTRIGRLPGPLQMPVAGLGGFAFPVCECGSVPVARRLAMKGLSPGAAVTFMLAAPILNPVVLVATAVAYRGRDILWPMVVGRGLLGFLVALAVGWAVGKRARPDLLRHEAHDETPDHDHGSSAVAVEPRWARFFGQLSGDVVMLGLYLVIGAAVAATLQTFVPQTIIDSVAGAPVLSVLALMGLAVVLSLCSESDAFVAASFVQFGMASQLAFLVIGPMIDTKLLFLYGGTFQRAVVRTIVVVVVAATFVASLWAEVLFG
jgi:hypothetical protein